MEPTSLNSKMVRLSIPYSIACGLFLIGLFFLTFYFGLNPMLEVSQLLFDVCVFGLFTFFAVKDFKSRSDGFLHFWQGMTLAFLVSAMGTALFVIALVISESFDPSLVIKYQADATHFLLERKDIYMEQFGEASYNAQLAEIAEVDFSDLLVTSGVKKLIGGLFLGPVISIMLRNKPK